MATPRLTLSVLPGRFAVCRLDPQASLPAAVFDGAFCSVTRTGKELSLVCDETHAPEGVPCEPGWACLQVDGPLAFSLTGVLASLATPLAQAGLSLFAVSTFDTDYLLVQAADLPRAVAALMQAGHTVRPPGAV